MPLRTPLYLDIPQIFQHLTKHKKKHGVIVFTYPHERDEFVDAYMYFFAKSRCKYDTRYGRIIGLNESTILLYIYFNNVDNLLKLKGLVFDRFWSNGDLPKEAIRRVMVNCR